MEEAASRKARYMPYGRPNYHFKFRKGLPIHLIVSYLPPGIFEVSNDGHEQPIFSEAIIRERELGTSFCLIE